MRLLSEDAIGSVWADHIQGELLAGFLVYSRMLLAPHQLPEQWPWHDIYHTHVDVSLQACSRMERYVFSDTYLLGGPARHIQPGESTNVLASKDLGYAIGQDVKLFDACHKAWQIWHMRSSSH